MTAPAFVTDSGMRVFTERDMTLPLVAIELVISRGSTSDPIGREGLTRLWAHLARRGPKGVSAEQFDERLDSLGSSLGTTVLTESTRVGGIVLARNLEPFLGAVGSMVTKPGLRANDFGRVRRRAQADVRALRDDDQTLAARAFRRHLFGRHPYGRPAWGTDASLRAISLDEVRAHQPRMVSGEQMILGVAGAFEPAELEAWVNRAFRGMGRREAPRPPNRGARAPNGRRVILVDKPQRTQTQLYVGTLGLRVGDRDHAAATVANTAFGGTFTSRLMREVRSKRGWSYSASSSLSADRQREAWAMWTHPAAERVLDCLRLELDLVEGWCQKGVSASELRSAKRYLIKSHPFERETAVRRLSLQLDSELYGLPDGWHEELPASYAEVTRAEALHAVRRFLDPSRLTIALVATRTDELERGLREIDGVRSVDVVSYDSL
ncbi:MAG: M16 family metallopeptidase [Sandaracinaceae bacterium]